MAELGRLGAQELAPRRGIEIEVGDRDRGALGARGGCTSPSCAPSAEIAAPCAASRVRLVIDSRATEAIEASASPRKPIVVTASRSSRLPILLVAWRASASGSSSRAMPAPSSSTWTRLVPPASSDHRDRARAGVDAVFQQFLEHRSGPLDDLARGDLADQKVRQDADGSHASIIESSHGAAGLVLGSGGASRRASRRVRGGSTASGSTALLFAHRFLRDRPGGDAVPARRLAAVRHRRGGRGGRHGHRAGDGGAGRRGAVRRQRQLLDRAHGSGCKVFARASSTRRT